MNEVGTPNLTLDVQGMLCPLPVIRAKKSLKSLNVGETLLVITTDPVALIDIPHMCTQLGHTLLQTRDTDTGHSFLIEKAS
ncbi:MAG: response regulator SirA [Cypionkella sp.]|uniref:sulfurtransferase TusA family protein n=1 Tax=Cypionkella sp. TaxID=2811411 RepID=UPI00260AEFCB|nr:sulfurtransferase TusA family protein [Cypionkella sp.]MDB5658096.1 response regulator SirA [Cypionkella sp.]